MSDENQGSFLGGLALGMFAGATGFFLFGTKDGSEIRKKIEKEWQDAKIALEKDGIIKNKNASLGDLIREWCGLEQVNKKIPSKTIKKKTVKGMPANKKTVFAKSSNPTFKTAKKFKGV